MTNFVKRMWYVQMRVGVSAVLLLVLVAAVEVRAQNTESAYCNRVPTGSNPPPGVSLPFRRSTSGLIWPGFVCINVL